MSSYKIVYSTSNETRRKDDKGRYVFGSQLNVQELLEKRVNTLIEQGWSCTGGVLINRSDSHLDYIEIYQAMIKNTNIKLDEQTKQNQELLTKLEEQIKLNGELCKRLFELKN